METRKVDVTAAKLVSSPWEAPRPGVHLSDLLHLRRMAMEEKFREALTTKDFHRFKVGDGFEMGVLDKGLLFDFRAHHNCTWKAYTFEEDGIHMTTDAVCLGACNEGRPLVWEIKTTKFSSRKTIMDPVWRPYFWQVMSYARALMRALGLEKPPVVRFVFCYLNGDYRNRDIEIVATDVFFTVEELENNWGQMLQTRDEYLAEREENAKIQ